MNKITTYLVFLITTLIFAQNKDQNLYNGTVAFDKKKYIDAEADFRIAQSNNLEKKAISDYNLGNSIYRQNKPGEAKYKYLNSIEVAKTKEEKHKAYHNLGNTFMQEENYQAAVEAYKNALRNNPYDEETRYNYALAKQKLKENPPQGNDNQDKKGGNDKNDQQNQNQDKDKGDNQDKQDKGNDQDKKENDKGNNEKDKQDKGNDKEDKGEGDDKEDKQNSQPKPSGANKQQIENLLDAVNNAEKKIQDKINAKKVKAQPVTNDKDW
ncbi:tetratricopeptide repeat protein [Flavobacterium sp.]|uniref:tetratricopeptide repeat protein n=1 Tax=Flavobacterium sp. TaxID=239 RepID=UPI003527922C